MAASPQGPTGLAAPALAEPAPEPEHVESSGRRVAVVQGAAGGMGREVGVILVLPACSTLVLR